MPPINQQGSRAGLVTGLVIFTILFVTAAIFAIYFNVQLRATDLDRSPAFHAAIGCAEVGRPATG